MKLKSIILSTLLLGNVLVIGQTTKNVLVEHFTNTNCSVCASRNPGFLKNYSEQTGLIRLTVFPSSPYASCLLSQQNKTDNDARTNYYGIYGATPKFVIQGSVVSSGTDINSSSLFSPYLQKTTPFQINIQQKKFNSDSIQISIRVKTISAHSFDSLLLFVALAEDTVFYTGGNGEKQHYNVFRKALNGATGKSVKIASQIGDSVVFNFSSKANSIWKFNRIYGMAFLQEKANKNIVQVNESNPNAGSTGSNSAFNLQPIKATIFPNPAQSYLNIELEQHDASQLQIITLQGQTVLDHKFNGLTQIDLKNIPNGIYLLKIANKNGVVNKRIVVGE